MDIRRGLAVCGLRNLHGDERNDAARLAQRRAVVPKAMRSVCKDSKRSFDDTTHFYFQIHMATGAGAWFPAQHFFVSSRTPRSGRIRFFRRQPQRLEPTGVLGRFLLIPPGHFGKPGIVNLAEHMVLIAPFKAHIRLFGPGRPPVQRLIPAYTRSRSVAFAERPTLSGYRPSSADAFFGREARVRRQFRRLRRHGVRVGEGRLLGVRRLGALPEMRRQRQD